MKSFIEYLGEALRDRVVTNPSTASVLGHLRSSAHGELRYVHNTKTGDTHVADAGSHSHTEMADHAGEHGFKRDFEGEPTHYNTGHFHAGMIYPEHANHIKGHGLKNWIKSRHHGLEDK